MKKFLALVVVLGLTAIASADSVTNKGGGHSGVAVSCNFDYSGTGTLYLGVTPVFSDGENIITGSYKTIDSTAINGMGNTTLTGVAPSVPPKVPAGLQLVGWQVQGYIVQGVDITAISSTVLIPNN